MTRRSHYFLTYRECQLTRMYRMYLNYPKIRKFLMSRWNQNYLMCLQNP